MLLKDSLILGLTGGNKILRSIKGCQSNAVRKENWKLSVPQQVKIRALAPQEQIWSVAKDTQFSKDEVVHNVTMFNEAKMLETSISKTIADHTV